MVKDNNTITPITPDFGALARRIQNEKARGTTLAGSGSSTFFDRGVNYDEYYDKGVGYILGADNYGKLAEAQPWYEQANRTLNPLKMLASIGLGIAENVGYLGDLAFDWDERDYTNGLVDWAIKNRQALNNPDNSVIGSILGKGEAYRKDPSANWDLGDSAWWFNNGSQLAESIGEFLVTGAGVGKGLSALARGLASKSGLITSNASAIAGITKGSQALAQLGTAGVLAYTEGAMSGARVYKDVYDNALQLGDSDEAAKNKASDAASHTVYLNTMINTLLNVTAVNGIFRAGRYADDVERFGLRAGATENTRDYFTRLKSLAANPELPNYKKKMMGTLGSEALQEGTEEVVNVYAEREGYERGGIGFNTLTDTIFSSEAGLNFVLGAVGGVGQTAAMSHIPFNKEYKKDEQGRPIPKRDAQGNVIEGQFETQLKSLEKVKRDNEFVKYTNFIKGFTEDLEQSFANSDHLEQLTKDRRNNTITQEKYEMETRKTRNELFNVSLLKSLYEGTANNLLSRFEEIGKIDNKKDLGEKIKEDNKANLEQLQQVITTSQDQNEVEQAKVQVEAINKSILENTGYTEAMKMGLSENESDVNYITEANKSAEKIRNRTQQYNKYISAYSYGDEYTFNLANSVFRLYSHVEDLKEAVAEIDNHIMSLEEFTPNSTTNMDAATLSKLILRQQVAGKALEDSQGKRNDIQALIDKQDIGGLNSARRKYKAKSIDDMLEQLTGETKHSIDEVNEVDKLINEEVDKFKALEENKNLTESEVRAKFFEGVHQNQSFNFYSEQRKSLLETKASYDASLAGYSSRLQSITTSKGRTQYIERAKKEFKELEEESENRRDETAQAARTSYTNRETQDIVSSIESEEDIPILEIPNQEEGGKSLDELGAEAEAKSAENKTARDFAIEFANTIETEVLELPSFDTELMNKRIDLLSNMFSKLEEEGAVKDTNDFAQVSYWMFSVLGEDKFKDIYPVFNDVYRVVKETQIKSGDVKNNQIGKSYEEMFASFDLEVTPEQGGFHGIDTEDEQEEKETEKVTLGDGEDFKLVNAANSIAQKTREFTENNKRAKKITNNFIYKWSNSDILTARVKEDDELSFRFIDINSDKVDDITKELERNKSGDFLRRPIQIVHTKTGNVVGYVHSIDYINDHRVTVKDDNINKQTKLLVALRESLRDNINQKAKITHKGQGFIMRNANIDPNTGYPQQRSGTEALRGDVEFAVFTGDGEFKTTHEAVLTKPLINRKNETNKKSFYKRGATYAILQTPTGDHYAHLLWTQKLNSIDAHTVIEVIKGAFNGDKDLQHKISDITGDNILTPKGLEDFVNRFVFTGKYNHDTIKVSKRKFLNVTTNGVNFSEGGGILNILKKDEANQDKKKALFEKLERHLVQMFFNINTSYLTKPDFAHVVVKDGVVTSTKSSYGEFIKSRILTELNPIQTGKPEDNEYAYFENPLMEFALIGKKNEEEVRKIENPQVFENKETTLETVSNNINELISSRKGKSLELPDFKEINKQFRTTRARLRNKMIQDGIINEYNQIIDDQAYYKFKSEVNRSAKNTFNYITEDLIDQSRTPNEKSKVIFREDYLKAIDTGRGIMYELPDFRSIDEIESSIEALEKSYDDFIVDRELFTPLEQEDMVKYLASEALKEIRKKQRITQAEAFRRVASKINITEDNKEIWNKFLKLAERRLKQVYQIRLFETDDDKQNDFIDSATEQGSKESTQNFDSGRVFKEDSKKSIGRELKVFFQFIKDGRTTKFGVQGYADFDTVYNSVKALMTNNPPDFNVMMKRLKDHSKSHSFMPDLINQLENADNQVKRMFVRDMNSHYTRWKSVQWNNKLHEDGVKDDKGHFVYNTTARVVDVDRNSIERSIMSTWAEGLKQSEMVRVKEGVYTIDLTKLRKVADKLEVVEPSDLEAIQAILDEIGVTMSMDALESLRTKSDSSVFSKINSWEGQFAKNGIFGRIISSMNSLKDGALNEEEDLEFNNPLYDNTGFTLLAKEEALFTDRMYSNSTRTSDGATIYSYSQNKHIIDRLAELKEVNSELLENMKKLKFEGTAKYLEWFTSNPTFKNRIEVFYPDSLYKKGRTGTKMDDLSKRELEMARLAYFFNEGRGTEDKQQRLINIITPTNSDKPIPLGLSTFGLNVKLKANGSIDDNTLDNIYNSVYGEIQRINLWSRLKKEGKLEEANNQEFEEGGGLFFLLPELNDKKKHSKLWVGDYVNIDFINSTDMKDYVKEYINKYIQVEADKKVEEWKDMSLIYINEGKEYLSFFDQAYIDKVIVPNIEDSKTMKGAAKFAAIDYLANYMFTYANVFQTIIGDPAMFYKPKKGADWIANIEATFINLGKRLANQSAAGTVGADTVNKKYINVFLKDLEGAVQDIEEMKKFFPPTNPDNQKKIDKNENVTKTDAQGLSTWKAALEWSVDGGDISDDEAKMITDTIEGNTDLNTLSPENKEIFNKWANPTKPVHTENSLNMNLGIQNIIYLKMAKFPLIPQLTKGKEIDKLRMAMERLERFHGKTVSAIYKSGAKTGSVANRNLLDIWTDDGKIKNLPNSEKEWNELIKKFGEERALEKVFGKSTRVLGSKYLRRQQEVPFDSSKTAIIDGTQQRMMMFLNILKFNGFKYQGKEMNGRALYNEYRELYKKLFENNRLVLVNELDYNEETGEINIKKLAKILQEEADKRNWSINDKKALGLEYKGADKDEATGFRTALWAVGNSAKFESMLKSLVDNRVLNNKRNGRSYVLGTGVGFAHIEGYSSLSKAEKGGIIYSKNFDPKVGLKPNQIFIPFRMLDDKGKAIDINSLTLEREDGVTILDETKFDYELLKVLGYRIPTEGLNSMSGLEVAGFLPDGLGDLVLVNDSLIPQMGTDFDLDKLYSFMYNTHVNENGYITKYKYDKAQQDYVRSLYEQKNDTQIEKLLRAILPEAEDILNEQFEVFAARFKKKELDNSLLDINFAVLNSDNKEVQRLIKSPLTYGKLTDLRDQLNEVNAKKGIISNILSPDYQRDKYLSGQQGQSGLGVFAQNMTFNAAIQLIEEDVYLNHITYNKNTGEAEEARIQINLGGHRSGVINRTKTVVGHRYKSEIFSAFTSAHADAEKEQIHSALNINSVTYDAIRILLSSGYEEDHIIYLINQPIILEYVHNVIQDSDSLHKQAGNVKKNVADALIAKYAELYKVKYKEEDYRDMHLGNGEMLDAITQTTEASNYGNIQLGALTKFLWLSRIGDAQGQVQTIVNTDAKGLGKDMIAVNNKLSRLIDLPNYEKQYSGSPVGFKNISKVVGNFHSGSKPKKGDYHKLGVDSQNYEIWLEPNGIKGYAAVYGLKQASDMFNQFFPYRSAGLRMVQDEVKKLIGKNWLTEDEQRWLWTEVKKFVNSRNSLGIYKSEDLNAERDRLLYDKTETETFKEGSVTYIREKVVNESIATRTQRLQKKYPRNMFLKSLSFKINQKSPSRIVYKAAKGENENEELIYQGLADLFLNPETLEDAKDILSYAYLTGGVQQAVEFMRYMPFEVLEITKFNQEIKAINFNDPETLGLVEARNGWDKSQFTRQLAQHNPNRAFILNDDLSQIEVKNKKKFTYFTPKKEHLEDFVISDRSPVPNTTNSYETLYKPFVAVFDKNKGKSYRLFEYVKPETGVGYYREIPTLGAFASAEYNAQEQDHKSRMPNNNVQGEEQFVQLSPDTILHGVGTYNSSDIAIFLQNFPTDSNYRTLATFLADALIAKNKDLKLKIDNVDANVYNPDTNSIILKKDTMRMYLEQTAVHEIVHSLTRDEVLESDNADVRVVVNRLFRLKKQVVDSLNTEQVKELEETQRVWNKYQLSKRDPKAPKLTPKERSYFMENRFLLYPLIDSGSVGIEEFITGVMTAPKLQALMNDIPYSENLTLLDRFLNLIADILSTFKINLNGKKIDIKEDSVMMQALKDCLYLISFNPETNAMIDMKADNVASYIGVTFTGNEEEFWDEENAPTLDVPRDDDGNLINDEEDIAPLMLPDVNMMDLEGHRNPTVRIARDKVINNENLTKEEYIELHEAIYGTKPVFDERISNSLELPSFSNMENFDKYKTFIKERKSRITRIKRAIYAENHSINPDEVKISNLKSRIRELEQELTDYENSITLDVIYEAGVKDLRDVATIVNSGTVNPYDLDAAYQVLNLWQRSKKILFDADELEITLEGEFSENVKKFGPLIDKADSLRIKLDEIRQDLLIKQAMSTLNVDYATAEAGIKNDMRDVGALTAYFRDISNYNNLSTSTLAKVSKQSANATNQEFIAFNNELNTIMKGVKGKSYDIMLQENNKGQKTGLFVTRYSDEYQKERKYLKSKAEETKDYTKYISWLRDETMIFDSNKLFKVEGDEVILNEDPKHKAELIEQLGLELYNNYLNKQKRKIETYLAEKERIQANVNESSELDDAQKQSFIEDWDKEHSPFVWSQYLAGGGTTKYLNSRGQFIRLQGYNYTQSFPKRIKNGVETKWWDAKYKRLEADAGMLAFYKFAIKTVGKMLHYTGMSDEMEYNTIPVLKKDLIDLFKGKDGSAYMIGLKDDLIRSVTSLSDSSIAHGERNSLTGLPERRLRVTMLDDEAQINKIYNDLVENYMAENNLFNREDVPLDAARKLKEQAEIQFNDSRSFDIPKVLTAFAAMSLNYKNKSKVEGIVRMIQSFVHNSMESYETQDGQPVTDRDGKKIVAQGQLSNLKKAVDYFVDVFFEHKQEDKSLVKKKLLTSDEASLKAKYEKQREKLQRDLEAKKISDEEFKFKSSLIKGKIEGLGKSVSLKDVGRLALKTNQLRGMGWNAFAGITNLVYGWMSNAIHAAGGEDFTISNLRKAKYYSLLLSKQPTTRNKIYNLMRKFDVLKESSEANSGKYLADKKKYVGFSNLKPYEIQKGSDYVVQSELMLAMMFGTKINDLLGGERNLYEAFNMDGSWNVKEFGENNDWAGDPNNIMNNKNAGDFKFKIDQLVKALHANVDPNSPILIKSSIGGRMLMQFRSWVPESFANRFEKEKPDYLLGRTKKGRYRSFFSLKDEEGDRISSPLFKAVGITFSSMLNILSYGLLAKSAGKKLSKVDRANLRKNAYEIINYVALYVFVLSLKGMDEDDEDKKRAINYMINQGYRLQSDIMFYTSPVAFENIADNALPIFGLVTDFYKWAGACTNLVFDYESDEYEAGPYEGHSKAAVATAKVLPLGTQIVRNYRALETVVAKNR